MPRAARRARPVGGRAGRGARDGGATPRAGASWPSTRPRRRRHQVSPTSPPVEATAAKASNGGASVRLAKGTDAAPSTIASTIRNTTQPGAASTAPTNAGAPANTNPPPARATSPTAMAGATSGTTARLTSGARIARRPNETSTIGSVAAWAANETPRLSASQCGSRPRTVESIQSVRGVAHAIRPAVASDESWNPASPMSLGSAIRSSAAAQPRAATARPARPVSLASRTTPPSAPPARPTPTRLRTRHMRRSPAS